MLGNGTRDARRTERYLDGLIAADERRADDVPADTDLDPPVRSAARELRAGLTRVHPSFRFEDALAARLSEGAARLKIGLPIEETAAVAGSGDAAGGVTAAGGSVGIGVGAVEGATAAGEIGTGIATAAIAKGLADSSNKNSNTLNDAGGGNNSGGSSQLPPRQFRNGDELYKEILDHNADNISRGRTSHIDELGGPEEHKTAFDKVYQKGDRWIQSRGGVDVADFYHNKATGDILSIPRNKVDPPTFYRHNQTVTGFDNSEDFLRFKNCRKANP